MATHPILPSRTLGFLLLVFLVIPAVVLAQAYFGTVSGEVTDTSGAVVPGVKVELTDVQKGFTFHTTSTTDGRYLFRSIPPGVYRVSTDAPGFEKATSTSLKVDINANATANLTLKIGATTQTVDVAGNTQKIDTEDAETGQVINRKFINDLPLIDRYVMDLTYLAPGVADMDDQCPNC